MKNRYFSISLVAGVLMCSALALSAHAEQLKRPVLGGGKGHQVDAEQKLQDDTLGGAIAPRQKDHEIPQNAGEKSDRIAGERDADSTGETDDDKPKMSYAINENPFAPKHPPIINNKVSRGHVPQITYRPGFGPPMPALTGDDMKRLAALEAQKVDINRLTEEQLTEMGLPPETSAAINGLRSPRIDGMLPTEFSVKSTIDGMMQLVMERQGESRKKAAEAAYSRLSQLADGMRGFKAIPESTYVKMGVGDGYITERKEAYTNGLGRLKEALEALEAIRKGEEER